MLIRTNVVNIGDPVVLDEGDHYVMYCSDYDVEGVLCRTSTDLANWEIASMALDGKDTWSKLSFWAPEVLKYKGKYYMHYTGRRTSDRQLRIGVAVADKPEGPFVDAHNGPMFDFGYACIDGHVFIDDDDQAYLYYSRDCSNNPIGDYKVSQIYAVKLSEDLLNVISDPVLITTPDKPYDMLSAYDRMWNEGPYVMKHEGEYYLTYSANFYASKDYCICLAKAKHPLGPFVKDDKNNPIVRHGKEGEDFSGPGHNYFFKDHDGNLKISFHIQTNEYRPRANRKAVIMDAKFEDGTIKVF